MELVESLKMSNDGSSYEGVVVDVKYLVIDFWVSLGFDLAGCVGMLVFRVCRGIAVLPAIFDCARVF